MSTIAYAYDNASRLQSVSDGVNIATYSYLANSPLVEQITFKQNSTTRMTTTKAYDRLNRLLSIRSTPAGGSDVSHVYAYNEANQRTKVNQADGSYWRYQYDSLGQVISGKKYWADGSPVAGQQFEYGFDDIGNRTSTKAGGNATGGSLRSASYTANDLNQYSQRTVPAGVDVIGVAHASATVTVNGQSTSRHGEYYRAELTLANGSGPIYANITNNGVSVGVTNTVVGGILLPPATQNFAYDPVGNLTNDGVWVYTWDGENRLVQMTNLSTVASVAQLKLGFRYDDRGRRVNHEANKLMAFLAYRTALTWSSAKEPAGDFALTALEQ